MPLKLMYITNRPEIAEIAVTAGVDRVFIDLETYGKSIRQAGMDTVQSNHTILDIVAIRKALPTATLLVRCNPTHDATSTYTATEEEIDAIVAAGADIIMLPYFRTVEEVARFLRAVNGRTRTMLLFETSEALENADEILDLPGIDEVFVGLNDLSLGYGRRFMFSVLAEGKVEHLCDKFRKKGYPYGFGGIAGLGLHVMLPAEKIIMEHYRLGSQSVILARSFCDTQNRNDFDNIRRVFNEGLHQIRIYESFCAEHTELYDDNLKEVCEICNCIEGAPR